MLARAFEGEIRRAGERDLVRDVRGGVRNSQQVEGGGRGAGDGEVAGGADVLHALVAAAHVPHDAVISAVVAEGRRRGDRVGDGGEDAAVVALEPEPDTAEIVGRGVEVDRLVRGYPVCAAACHLERAVEVERAVVAEIAPVRRVALDAALDAQGRVRAEAPVDGRGFGEVDVAFDDVLGVGGNVDLGTGPVGHVGEAAVEGDAVERELGGGEVDFHGIAEGAEGVVGVHVHRGVGDRDRAHLGGGVEVHGAAALDAERAAAADGAGDVQRVARRHGPRLVGGEEERPAERVGASRAGGRESARAEEGGESP